MEIQKESTLGYHWLDSLIKNKNKFMINNEDTFKTNVLGLDEKIHGLVQGQLYVLAARPAEGKTTLAINLILRSLKNLKENEIIIFISLEMSAKEILNRILKILNNYEIGISLQELMNTKKLLIIDYSHSNVSNIKKIIQEQQKTKIVKSVFIDHLQLLETSNINLPRYEKMTQITRELKIVARETNINILAVSQLSRDVEKRTNKKESYEIQLSDLRDSGSIEQDADIVLFLYKPKTIKTKEGKSIQNKNQHIIQIGKNRNGSLGMIPTIFFKDKCLFTFLEDYKNEKK
ncbi:DnaB-like helicase C-terminal domain-containing protein [Mycoplasmopsis lipofaciens]|uniref:DnaB-like helicase C-terminal domain-containing protein n=1 Tax=Mycoplasmopsis lipofaciens TaxID=114884 RepID=UPI00068BB59A|nr:DnaB-like helicase C-terminal domain-containing protein [Mycoplasmopsis lipofaciens]